MGQQIKKAQTRLTREQERERGEKGDERRGRRRQEEMRQEEEVERRQSERGGDVRTQGERR